MGVISQTAQLARGVCEMIREQKILAGAREIKLRPKKMLFIYSFLLDTYTIYIYTPALICNRNHQLKPDKITLASDHFKNVFIFDIDLTKKV